MPCLVPATSAWLSLRSARVIVDRDTGRPKGFGFVSMAGNSSHMVQRARRVVAGHLACGSCLQTLPQRAMPSRQWTGLLGLTQAGLSSCAWLEPVRERARMQPAPGGTQCAQHVSFRHAQETRARADRQVAS